jgi:hypothetical protein
MLNRASLIRILDTAHILMVTIGSYELACSWGFGEAVVLMLTIAVAMATHALLTRE